MLNARAPFDSSTCRVGAPSPATTEYSCIAGTNDLPVGGCQVITSGRIDFCQRAKTFLYVIRRDGGLLACVPCLPDPPSFRPRDDNGEITLDLATVFQLSFKQHQQP